MKDKLIRDIKEAQHRIEVEDKNSFLEIDAFEYQWQLFSKYLKAEYGEYVEDYVCWFLWEMTNSEDMVVEYKKVDGVVKYHIETVEDLADMLEDFDYINEKQVEPSEQELNKNERDDALDALSSAIVMHEDLTKMFRGFLKEISEDMD